MCFVEVLLVSKIMKERTERDRKKKERIHFRDDCQTKGTRRDEGKTRYMAEPATGGDGELKFEA